MWPRRVLLTQPALFIVTRLAGRCREGRSPVARRPDLHSIVSKSVTTVLQSSQICCERGPCLLQVRAANSHALRAARPGAQQGPRPVFTCAVGAHSKKTP